MKRLSLAELKAKANVLSNTEFITGGEENICHIVVTGTVPARDGVVVQPMIPR